MWKMENSPPPPFENSPPQTSEFAKLDEISDSILVKTFFFFFFFYLGDHLILGGKNLWISEFGRKITPNFGEDLFFFFFFSFFWRSPNFGRKKPLNFGIRPKNHSEFWRRPFFFIFLFLFLEITQLWAEKSFEFPSFPRHFVSSFGQTVWNWFKINEISSQGRLHTSHSFKIAHPFSKSWLRAWPYYRIFASKSNWILQKQLSRCFDFWDKVVALMVNRFSLRHFQVWLFSEPQTNQPQFTTRCYYCVCKYPLLLQTFKIRVWAVIGCRSKGRVVKSLKFNV